MSEMRVMVLGAGGPAADNYIKSLRLADPDIYTLGVDTHPLMLELSSASETRVIDTVPEDEHGHLETIYRLIDEFNITMVHAQPDQEARFISKYDASSSGPDMPMFEACQDKLRCAELLGDLAPVSHSYRPTPMNFLYPLSRSYQWIDTPVWMRARTGAGSLAAKVVRDASQMNEWARVWKGRVAPEDFMLSEYLPGEDRSYTGVWWRGEAVASACRVRVEYADTRTPSGQCSSPRIAKLDSRPETFDVAEQAIRRVSEATNTQPHGVFYVDMREAADGRLLVTEINAGRFNTTQNFYAEAGLNLPYVHAALHHGSLEVQDDGSLLRHGPSGRQTRFSKSLLSTRLIKADTDIFWLRQPDMGHKLLIKSKVTA